MDRLDGLSLGAINLVGLLILAATQWGFQVFWYAALMATPVMLGILIRISYAGDEIKSSSPEG